MTSFLYSITDPFPMFGLKFSFDDISLWITINMFITQLFSNEQVNYQIIYKHVIFGQLATTWSESHHQLWKEYHLCWHKVYSQWHHRHFYICFIVRIGLFIKHVALCCIMRLVQSFTLEICNHPHHCELAIKSDQVMLAFIGCNEFRQKPQRF